MPRMTWSAPEGRFFDAGLDRGVLYPKNPPPPGRVLKSNLVPNPTLAVNASLYSASGPATVTRDTPTWRPDGALRVASTGAGGNGSAAVVGGLAAGGMRLGMSAGKMYAFSGDINTPTAQTGTLSDQARRMVIAWRAGTSGWTYAMSTAGPTTGIARVEGSVTLPPDTTEAYLMAVNGSPTAGEWVWWDNLLLTEVDPETYDGTSEYFDGTFPETGLVEYAWLGTPHASASVYREKISLAVPWVGLTNVEEQGGDGAAAYYIDGRPFLFLPKPKEYAATLKAYTYPDAFSEIMGITEIADGMYLDSQPGDAFDLSYRTKVGNALQGVDHGYKIHLVYNAVVTPQSLSYDTLGSSVNPVEFSWDIQAVPVKVEGFRPTAHIIIDTRHMSSSVIQALEALLYGDESHLPGMPSPQTIFDMLSFGDAIIVTDLGDGTFSVEGSYENVYMVSPGVFRVDNVDGETYADGTYRISSTNV